MAEIKFVEGLFIKRGEKAPDFVMGNLSIEVDKFRNWLIKNQEGKYINIKLLKSKKGGYYAQVDDWKPEGEKVVNNDTGLTEEENKTIQEAREQHNKKFEKSEEEINVEDIPF